MCIRDRFIDRYLFMTELVEYVGFYEEFLDLYFSDLIDQGIFRYETRIYLGNLRNEYGKVQSIRQDLEVLQRAEQRAKTKNPAFSLGLIWCSHRGFPTDSIRKSLLQAFELKKEFPQLIVGFDLVSCEDLYGRMEDLLHCFSDKEELEQKSGIKLDFCFHCGESLSELNNNTVYAYLLKSRRFGHCLNLMKDPYLIPKIREEGRVVELNPTSNQILRLVPDLRLHPGVLYHAMGIKVCLSDDDPTVMGTRGVNHDFFVAAIAFNWKLRDLKRVCLNGIDGMIAEDDVKNEALKHWMLRWDAFIEWLNNQS
eukprot:TRINITY_DN14704_c0_g1_i1.p1 TRINITY_DN14704_c0_g1~~TRINITY_DN14704_c0_g1_i1.p1  ORF type:complete len:330 (-),score=64.78 TRINITY_DN14704_c0_g1_i1:130-1059(-)